MDDKECDVCSKTSSDCTVFNFRDFTITYCPICLDERQNGAVRRRGQTFAPPRKYKHGVWCKFKKFFTK